MDQPCPLMPGQIVRSKAGHDRGSVFLVLKVCDAKHVTVVDGTHRPLHRPKKKRVIHLQPYRDVVPDFETMKQDTEWNDARVRALLAPYRQPKNKEES